MPEAMGESSPASLIWQHQLLVAYMLSVWYRSKNRSELFGIHAKIREKGLERERERRTIANFLS
jgi:hypothetical protein